MRNIDFDKFIQAIREVVSVGEKPVGLHEPFFHGNEWNYVRECLDTGWVSSVGKFVDRFEEQLAEFTGVKRAVAVVNGTAALHMSLKLVDVQPEDEVLVPALTFVATANTVVYCQATHHFVDSEESTLGIDVVKLESYLRDISEIRPDGCFNKKTGKRIKAVVPMHTFGHPVDIKNLITLCERYKLELVEDAAESLGSYYKGRHTGTWGRVAALSFNGNKIITTGGGGAILTNDENLGRLAKHLTTTAKVPHKWSFYHDQVGYNYRLPNLNAALGCAQLEQLPEFLQKKRLLASRYQMALEKVEGVKFVTEPDCSQSNYWLNAVLLERGLESQRDMLLENTHANGILTRPAWTLMHKLPAFQDCPRMELSTADSIEARLINLPSSVFL